MSRPLRPHAQFDHGPEHPDEVSDVPTVDFTPRTKQEILESDAFRLRFGDHLRDQLDDAPCAVLALYVSRGDSAEAGRYLAELLEPLIADVVKDIREDDLNSGGCVRR